MEANQNELAPAEENTEELLFADSDFELSDGEEVRIDTKHPVTQEVTGSIVMKHVGMPVIDTYRAKRNGDGRNSGNPSVARTYLFKVAFLRFEPRDPKIKLPLKPKQTQLDFFLEKGKLVDRVIIQYLGETYPDVETGK